MATRSYVRFHDASARTREAAAAAGLFETDELAAVSAFFDGPGLMASTPLVPLKRLADSLGLADVWVKDESSRGGLNAFKIVGVTYALARLVGAGRVAHGATVVAATAGNHGRAVARAAALHGLQARIYVPAGTVEARIDALRSEGAVVRVSDGSYEQAVREAASDAAREGWLVVSDTAWPGYEEIPRWIMAGYTQIAREAYRQLPADRHPTLVLIQGGVGGLVCGASSWLAHTFGAERPYVVACEPSAAACMTETARVGEPVTIADVGATTMNGLRCAEVSPLAWRGYRDVVDAFVAIDDDWTFRAMRALAHPGPGDPVVTAGASGACGLGTLLAIASESALEPMRHHLHPRARVLVINTEGATDPALYDRVVAT
ncbi:MAG: diaminopropionate ammonia-lyase [Vicinamibacterales bacterium]